MSEGISLLDGVVWYFVFLFSTTLHEASHAFAALRLGDDTAHRGGQVTLDPTPHIRREPFGMVVVPILTYVLGGWMMGWASAPYDPRWANRYPRRAGLMALAGPLSNLSLLIIAALLIRLGMAFGIFSAPDSINFGNVVDSIGKGVPNLLAVILSITFSLNLILFLFNLFPLPPLDGSALPLLWLSHEQAARYSAFLAHPGIAIFGILVAWKVFGAVYSPIHLFAINLLYPGLNYR